MFTTVPHSVQAFFSYFPLQTLEAVAPSTSQSPSEPTLWILPPKNRKDGKLSWDVECLKWQAYLKLRGVKDIALRWDIDAEGAVNGALPTLHLPTGQLLGSQDIPSWVDKLDVTPLGEFEGYRDAEARDESRAWVCLLEGAVHAALVLSNPVPFSLLSTFEKSRTNVAQILQPPPAPLSGISNPLPTSAPRIPTASIELQFRQAIEALSERLSGDKWFLGSSAPTALDALVFAYVHRALQDQGTVRREVERKVNLVAWERKVRAIVEN